METIPIYLYIGLHDPAADSAELHWSYGPVLLLPAGQPETAVEPREPELYLVLTYHGDQAGDEDRAVLYPHSFPGAGTNPVVRRGIHRGGIGDSEDQLQPPQPVEVGVSGLETVAEHVRVLLQDLIELLQL